MWGAEVTHEIDEKKAEAKQLRVVQGKVNILRTGRLK